VGREGEADVLALACRGEKREGRSKGLEFGFAVAGFAERRRGRGFGRGDGRRVGGRREDDGSDGREGCGRWREDWVCTRKGGSGDVLGFR
jgi:hypothetical protein